MTNYDLKKIEEKEVSYFGFGANKSPRMMKAIIGRTPKGRLAVLRDYELCIETWNEMSRKVKESLSDSWDKNFQSYTIRERKGSFVSGTVWEVTSLEKEFIKNWELCGLWSRSVKVFVKDKFGEIYDAETEKVDNYNVKKIINGLKYPAFPVSQKRMLEVARKDRELFMKKYVKVGVN